MSKDGLLTDEMRLENAMKIWIRDLKPNMPPGQRLTVAALGYEHILKLREIITRVMYDRKRRIEGRWKRRHKRRAVKRILAG